MLACRSVAPHQHMEQYSMRLLDYKVAPASCGPDQPQHTGKFLATVGYQL